MKMIFYGFLIYFLYKLIFQVVVPVGKGVQSVRQNMERMQKQQEEAAKNAYNSSAQNTPKQGTEEAEYIEFEEVKKK